ncbi:MAG: FAA hydrolase family protein [Mesorhizobium amorphae]|nr:MAG: FAA hydrolase family protein [Mesorhizobium amorphae]
MKLVTFRASSEAPARLGVVMGESVVDVEALALSFGEDFPATMLELIELGPDGLAALKRLLDSAEGHWPVRTTVPLSNVRLLAPIPRLRKNIFGIGLNYVEHVEESARTLDTAKELPKQPVIFSKPPTAVIGPFDPIEHNKDITRQLDWEVELAVVIGRTARRVTPEEAMSHVFGYSVMVDVSARDNRRAGQWIYSKGQDSFAPFGPALVTADAIGDVHALDLWLTVNGEVKQSSNTRHMLFKIPTLISDISQAITLEPGDVIATGTPEGVGAGRSPQEWLWPGDVVEAHVEGIGSLRNPVVAVPSTFSHGLETGKRPS